MTFTFIILNFFTAFVTKVEKKAAGKAENKTENVNYAIRQNLFRLFIVFFTLT